MPKFAYTVKNSKGKTLQDMMEATNREYVIDTLQKQGYYVVDVTDVQDLKKSSKQFSSYKKEKRKFSHHKAILADLITFSQQLATMLEAGVTLIRSLDVIVSQVDSQQFYLVLVQVRKDVEQGSSLSAAMGKHPKVFNQFWVSLIEVGEASGTIPSVLNKLSFYLERQSTFRSTVLSALIYPFILLGVSVSAIFFFAFFVAPKFEIIFSSLGAKLPILTQIMLAVFDFIQTFFITILVGLIVLVIIFRQYFQTYQGRLLLERIMFGLKKFGNIYRLIIVERFTSQMAILIDAGVPILYALDISERLVDNKTCGMVIAEVKEGVRSGELLVAPMERSGFFPPMCIQMIMVGEETGELSKMLNHVSHYYQQTVEVFMKRFSTIIEPLLLICLGVTIGTIIIAMFLPLFNIGTITGG